MTNKSTKPTIKLSSNKLIEIRDSLIQEIKKYWYYIRIENVTDMDYKRMYDIKYLYNTILDKEKKLIKIKLLIQCINMGLKSLSELNENSSYNTIYELSVKKEHYEQLQQIPTLKPFLTKKLKKMKVKPTKTEILTQSFIKDKMDTLNKDILMLRNKLEKFNEQASIEVEVDSDEAALIV